MSLKINDDPVSTPASEWAEQTTTALGSSASSAASPYDVNKTSSTGSPFGLGADTGSTATTPGGNVPGSFPRSHSDNAEPVNMTLPDVSQHVANAKEYITNVDVAQHVETVRQYLPAAEDVQAAVLNAAQTVGQYLPAGVRDAAQELVGRGNGTTPHDVDSDLNTTTTDEPSIVPSERPVADDAALLDPTSTAFISETSPRLDVNDDKTHGQSEYSTVADTQHAARIPLPPPTTSFSQPTVDVSKDEDGGSPVVTVHPGASVPDLDGVETGTWSSSNDVGRPDDLPSFTKAHVPSTQSTGLTTSTAPTGLEKPVSVPLSGALSSPPPHPPSQPQPKSLSHPQFQPQTPALPPNNVNSSTRQDAESRSTSSDAAIPSMGSDDKLGGSGSGTASGVRSLSSNVHDPSEAPGDTETETGADSEADMNSGKEKKGGASKLLGKMKEKLKSGQKA